MIAHEINAPVGALRTWAAVIRMKCPQRVFRDDETSAHAGLEQALGRIDYEANPHRRHRFERARICEKRGRTAGGM